MSQPFALPELERLARDAERTCQHCKHWKPIFQNVGTCRRVEGDGIGPDTDNLAHTTTALLTQERFGCNLWGSK